MNRSTTFNEQLDIVFDLLDENGFSWDNDYIRTENFATISVTKDSDVFLKLDFVNDSVPLFGAVTETSLFYRTDSVRNILSNKLSAIFRYAAKDVADIREIALHEPIDWSVIIQEARRKEAGIDLILISEILRGMPEHEFKKINWVRETAWDVFQDDIVQIAYEMLKG